MDSATCEFSIVIPVFNDKGHLKNVLDALKILSFRSFEVIIVDDGSDNKVEISNLESNAKILRLSHNFGAGYARNFGAAQAKGKVLVFLDSDVIPSQQFLEVIQNEVLQGSQIITGKYFYDQNKLSTLGYVCSLTESAFWNRLSNKDTISVIYGGLCAFTREAWFSPLRSFLENKLYKHMANGEDSFIVNELSSEFRIVFRSDLVGEHISDLSTRFFKRGLLQAKMSVRNFLSNRRYKFNRTALRHIRVELLILSYLIVFSIFFSASSLFFPTLVIFLGLQIGAYLHVYKACETFIQRVLLIYISIIQQASWVVGVILGFFGPLIDWLRDKFEFAGFCLRSLTTSNVNRLIFFVSNRCNFSCSWCLDKNRSENNVGAAVKDELTIEEIRQLTISSQSRLTALTITGGEPFLRKDIDSIIYYFYKNMGVRFVTVITNGSKVNEAVSQIERVLILCKYIKIQVQVTVSDTEFEHNKIRGSNTSYSQIIEISKKLNMLKLNFPNLLFVVTTQLEKINMSRSELVIEEVKSRLNPDQHIVTFVRDLPKLISEPFTDVQNGANLYNKIKSHYVKSRSFFSLLYFNTIAHIHIKIEQIRFGNNNYKPCVAGKKFITLYENGNILVCENRQDLVMGNVRESGLRLDAAVNSEHGKSQYKKQLSDKCQCDWGCAVGENETSSPFAIMQILRNTTIDWIKSL